MTVVDQFLFSKNALNQYAQKIGKLIDTEVANEESFYADFRDLLKNFFKTDEFEIIIVPKSEETTDKPDFIVYMDNIPIIHVEGKNPYDPVDKWLLADTTNRLFDQVYRFRGREDNNIPVIVTDFIHIWIIDKDTPNSKDANHQVKIKLKIIDDSGTSWKVYSGIKSKLESALSYVCEDIVISISKVSSMIPHLVKYAKKLKEKIIEVFKEPSNPMKNYLENIRNDFLESIFSSDKEKKSQEFADLFAQTLIYGGFIAWMRFCKEGNSTNDFSFGKATDYLPYGTFIYNIFADMSTKSSPNIRKNIFEKIERIFQSTQFEKITQNTETLMITFYSSFLWQYDPEIAKDRGIVFTPHSIISFIIRGINYFLSTKFNLQEGIVTNNIKFLDPAAGTMGFPCEIVRFSKRFFENKFQFQPGRAINEFEKWVSDCFLNNTFAFEILMAPYVLGHLRTNMLLEELGAKFDSSKDSIKLYLFNTLMELQTRLSDFRNPIIGQEIVQALRIRNDQAILVICGNPPYNVSSQNNFEWINKMINYEPKHFTAREKDRIEKTKTNENLEIKNIKKEKNDYIWDLQREGTKNISGLKGLKDDYVKFIRFAQWKIKENNIGIFAYITNGYYIDGIIFRGMRSSLKRDFDEIWIVDLHGDARKGLPISIKKNGILKDENVFDIRPGVAIAFFIRLPNHSDDKCIIKYIDKWGSKIEKYDFLDRNNIENLEFIDVPERIDYEFDPDEFEFREKYLEFPYFLDIFKKNVVGIVSGHDNDIIGYDVNEVKFKLKKLFNHYLPIVDSLPDQTTKTWNPKKIKKTTYEKSLITIYPFNWRGFDVRFISYNEGLIGRGMYEIFQYLIPGQNNLTLVVNRQSRGIACELGSSAFITNTLFDNACNEGASGLHSYCFPLKIGDSDLPDNYRYFKLALDSNIKEDFKRSLNYFQKISDLDIFNYIYGILYSPTYRNRYFIGLMEDYPRIPFPDSYDQFAKMSNLGERFVGLHLLRDEILDTTNFPMSSSTDYKVYYIRSKDKDDQGNQIPDTYNPNTKRIYFNKRTKTQLQAEVNGDSLDEITWIGEITQEMWDFEIGGRQQLKEWLYARRYSEEIKKNTIQRPLNNDELDYFLKMCDAIRKTIDLLPLLDEIYKKIDP